MDSHNWGTVEMDYLELQAGRDYKLVYEFFDKEITAKTHEMEEDTTQMSNTACSEPFITEELLVISKNLMKERIQSYVQEQNKDEKSIEEFSPDFESLDNEKDKESFDRSVFHFGSLYYYNYV